jgi:hypothetical protein
VITIRDLILKEKQYNIRKVAARFKATQKISANFIDSGGLASTSGCRKEKSSAESAAPDNNLCVGSE